MAHHIRRLPLTARLYGLLVMIIFGGIVVTAPFSVGFGTLFPHQALLIKSWKEILMGVALILSIFEVSRRHMWRQLFSDWAIRLITLFGLIHIALLGYHYQGVRAASAGILIDLRYLLFFVLVYVLVQIAPWYRLRLLIVSAAGAVIVVVFGTLQLFLPRDILAHIGYGKNTIEPYLTVDKNPDYVRISSTLRGPNPLGAYVSIVLTAIASILARRRSWLNARKYWLVLWALSICALVTLWLSYSRSAWLATMLAVLIVAATAAGRHFWKTWRVMRWFWLALVIVVILAVVSFGKTKDFVDNVAFHNNPTTGSSVKSDQAHLQSLENGVARFVHQPLGGGIGSTGSASILSSNSNIIENQYLFVAHESGWLGLGLFVAIFVLVLLRAWHQRRDWLALTIFASGIGLTLIGLTLPVFADDTVSIVWWGLAGIVYAGVQSSHGTGKSSHQKTT